MRKMAFLTIVLAVVFGCNTKTSEEKIDNLNGYWEIKQADLPEGISKEFKFSEIVDYIQVKGDSGFRRKVRPQLDGTFISQNDQEIFTIKVENDSINLYYATPYANWKETVISSEENELMILNPRGIIYTYKRFTPYSIDYGEENQ